METMFKNPPIFNCVQISSIYNTFEYFISHIYLMNVSIVLGRREYYSSLKKNTCIISNNAGNL